MDLKRSPVFINPAHRTCQNETIDISLVILSYLEAELWPSKDGYFQEFLSRRDGQISMSALKPLNISTFSFYII